VKSKNEKRNLLCLAMALLGVCGWMAGVRARVAAKTDPNHCGIWRRLGCRHHRPHPRPSHARQAQPVPVYDVTTWYGVFAPRGTPRTVIDKLNNTLSEIMTESSVRERLAGAGVTVQGSTPEALAAFMCSEFARWKAVRQAAGIEQRYRTPLEQMRSTARQ
jgi:hypothetical protein